ncbi:hypothetical protein SARC_11161 [Sphaeroforma arctica JP610]|uniref:Uncharacterized protein n=1 Tax=Sphaeroforma arctica JP610 TaxID=667725 RepID=A0A0L0FHU2_9EUKA|nr:hypothetical protein SARC_11161 [Sphaeroforma arctica JP610]KNC76330.1 hypothetical protein SARC_11161 [Sphaeroforma arctica JP610]|eukprot:XP_014150232.1 hypothetical protein SARC_11161 [Sphaeroforma arctica JP610]
MFGMGKKSHNEATKKASKLSTKTTAKKEAPMKKKEIKQTSAAKHASTPSPRKRVVVERQSSQEADSKRGRVYAGPSVTGRKTVTFNRRVEVADTYAKKVYNRRVVDETDFDYASLRFAAQELQAFKRSEMLVVKRCHCEIFQLQRPFKEIRMKNGTVVNNFHEVTSFKTCEGTCAFVKVGVATPIPCALAAVSSSTGILVAV